MANYNSYDVGSVVSVIGTFKDKAQVVQDPTTVTLKLKDPSGTSFTYTYALAQVIKDSVGVYRKDVDTTLKPGKWLYRWESTGQYQAASDNAFIVRPSPLSP